MPRRGYTLIEVLVVVTVSTVLLGVAAGVLCLLLRAERGGREHVYRASVVARLSDQFRRDVHAALHTIPADAAEKGQWSFAMPDDHVVAYRVVPGEIERRERLGEKLVRRESYALAADSSAEIVVHAGPAPSMASLVIRLPTPAADEREIHVDAVVGRDHRFAKSPQGSP